MNATIYLKDSNVVVEATTERFLIPTSRFRIYPHKDTMSIWDESNFTRSYLFSNVKGRDDQGLEVSFSTILELEDYLSPFVNFNLGGGNGLGVALFTKSDGTGAIFADFATRDAWFANNPDDLTAIQALPNAVIKVLDDGNGDIVFQQIDGTTWKNVNYIIQGEKGDGFDLSTITDKHHIFNNNGAITQSSVVEEDSYIRLNKNLRVGDDVEFRVSGSNVYTVDPATDKAVTLNDAKTNVLEVLGAFVMHLSMNGMIIVYRGSTDVTLTLPNSLDGSNTPPFHLPDNWSIHVINDTDNNVTVSPNTGNSYVASQNGSMTANTSNTFLWDGSNWKKSDCYWDLQHSGTEILTRYFEAGTQAELKEAIERNTQGLAKTIRLTNNILTTNETFNLNSDVAIIGTGVTDVSFGSISLADQVTWNINGGYDIEFHVPMLSAELDNVDFTFAAPSPGSGSLLFFKTIGGLGSLTLNNIIVRYESQDGDITTVLNNDGDYTQQWWLNTNSSSGDSTPDNFHEVSTVEELKTALETNYNSNTNYISPLNNITILQDITFNITANAVILNEGVIGLLNDKTITFAGNSFNRTVSFYNTLAISSISTHTTTLAGNMHVDFRRIKGGSELVFSTDITSQYEILEGNVTVTDSSTGNVNMGFWDNTNTNVGIDSSQFDSTGQVPEWSQANGRFEKSGILRSLTTSNNNEFQIPGGIRIQGARDEGIKFSGEGEIHSLANDILYTDNNVSHSLLHSISGFIEYGDQASRILSPYGNEFYKHTGQINSIWTLPSIDFGGISGTTVANGYNFSILNLGNQIELNVNSGSLNTFQDGTTITKTLASNTLTFVHVASNKWSSTSIDVGALTTKDRTVLDSFTVTAQGNILAKSGFTVETSSINFGEDTKLSEGNGSLVVTSIDEDSKASIITAKFDKINGSSKPSFFKTEGGENIEIIQSVDDTEITATQNAISISVNTTAQVNSFRLKAFGDISNMRIRYTKQPSSISFKHLPSTTAWETNLNGYDYLLSNQTLEKDEFDQPLDYYFISIDVSDSTLKVEEGETYILEIVGDVINLKGSSIGEPYIDATGNAGKDVTISVDKNKVGITSIDSPYQVSNNESLTIALDGDDIIINAPTNPVIGSEFEINELFLIGSNNVTITDTENSSFAYNNGNALLTDVDVIHNQNKPVVFIWEGSRWDIKY